MADGGAFEETDFAASPDRQCLAICPSRSSVSAKDTSRRTLAGGFVRRGWSVGIIALPLAMAFGINSIPDAVVASRGVFLHQPPGSSRRSWRVFLFPCWVDHVQIGGPTGAFMVIVCGIRFSKAMAAWRPHGDGGPIIILMGLIRLGR